MISLQLLLQAAVITHTLKVLRMKLIIIRFVNFLSCFPIFRELCVCTSRLWPLYRNTLVRSRKPTDLKLENEYLHLWR